MARWKTLPFAYYCPITGMIVKTMDLSKNHQKISRKFYSPWAKKVVECKCKQHKHS